MVAALRTAAGKQPHSRFVALGTRPADPEHWFAKMLAGSADYAQSPRRPTRLPEIPQDDLEEGEPEPVPYADLLVAIQSEAQQAKRDPALLASFEALRLNLGTEDAEVSTLLDAGLDQPAVGRDQPALEIGGHLLASNGWKIEREKGIFGHGGRGAFVVWEEMRFAPTFYPISTTYAMSATATSDRAE